MPYTHRWEDQGHGKAPFRVVGVISLPSPELAEVNPTAYNLALYEATEAARHL